MKAQVRITQYQYAIEGLGHFPIKKMHFARSNKSLVRCFWTWRDR
ncbi:hypothetical protein [Pseudanabaena sp. UWO311]|nr:hypothetical protein [Pseudanabaena sp. UWO311]